uniref:uncharacterized protein n=1 Tax=Pristiophorus japonicus TaxID=55135 RepID=UPI00398F5675
MDRTLSGNNDPLQMLRDDCGYDQVDGRTLSITPLARDYETTAAPWGNGAWCVSTTATEMTITNKGGDTSCAIMNTDFCFTPHDETHINGYVINSELKEETINGTMIDSIREGYEKAIEPQGKLIPQLNEEQTRLEQDIRKQRLKYIILMEDIDKLQRDTEKMLAIQPWYKTLECWTQCTSASGDTDSVTYTGCSARGHLGHSTIVSL